MANTKITAANIDSTSTGFTFADLTVDTTTLVVDASNNRVGIGTASPAKTLHLAAGSSVIRLEDTDGGYGEVSGSNGNIRLRADEGNTQASSFMSFDIDSTEEMRLTSTGLGIGRPDPQTKLHIEVADNTEFLRATITGNESWAFKGASVAGTSTDTVSFGIAGGTQCMTWQEDGSVGVGTISPDFTLDVEADKDTWISRIYNTGSDANAQTLLVRSDATAAHDATVMGVYADSGYKMIVKSTGKLLIGDSASHTDDLLQIETPASGGGHGIQIRRNDSNNDQGIGRIMFGNNTDTDLATIQATTDGSSDNARIGFFTQPNGGSSTERMRIHASGCVGIGSTVDRSIGSGIGTLVINGSGGGGLWLSDDDQSSTTSKIYAANNGSVGELIINNGAGVGSGGIIIQTNETERLRITSSTIQLNGGNQSYSNNQRVVSESENISWSSSTSAQSWTSSNYLPYQKFVEAALHFGYVGNGAISQHFYISLLNNFTGLSIQTIQSSSGNSGSSYHTISFTSTGAYNTRRLVVQNTPAGGQNTANLNGTIYYGFAR